MNRNNFLLFFAVILFSHFSCSMDRDKSVIEANLLFSKLKNYENKTYPMESAWLEYQIELVNNDKHILSLCYDNQVNLIIKSKQGKIIDSLYVMWGKNMLLPLEKDTIRVVDLFAEKEEKVSGRYWLDPDILIFKCRSKSLENSLLDSVIQINTYKIKKSDNFKFTIE